MSEEKVKVDLIEENGEAYFQFPDRKLKVIGIDQTETEKIFIACYELEDTSTQISIWNKINKTHQSLFLTKETLEIFLALIFEHSLNRELNFIDIAKNLTLSTNYEPKGDN